MHFSDCRRDFSPERPRPHPSERSDSSFGEKEKRIPQRFERKNAGAPTAVRRSRAGQTRAVEYARPASEDVDRRARVSEETQASRGRRGRARGTPAACASADAPVRVSELLRSPQRAKILSKLQADREKKKELRCFSQKNATTEKVHAGVSQNR